MMIVVVMLSSTADMKKVMKARSHIRRRFSRVVMWSVMMEKPPCMSIRSTMVMAPIRNMSVSHVSPRYDTSSPSISASPEKMLNTVQIMPHMSSAKAALSILILCSSAIHT